MDWLKNKLIIRKISEKDIEKFRELYKEILGEAFIEYPPKSINYFVTEDFSKEFENKKSGGWKSDVWVAFGDEKMLGFLMAEKLYAGVSFCNWLGVIKEFRGKGIGKALSQKWQEDIKKEGGHKLMLLNHSPKNNEFYLKMGFKQEGFEEKLWYGLDYWVFGKVIGEVKGGY